MPKIIAYKGFMLILAEPWNCQFLFQMFCSSNNNDDIMSLYLKCTYSGITEFNVDTDVNKSRLFLLIYNEVNLLITENKIS